jgi:hypothetical protein
MLVPYNYEMVKNDTEMSNDALVLSDVVLDVEYAITDMLLKNLFSECAAYYHNAQGIKRWVRHLVVGQVIGISSQPNDIVTDGKQDGLQIVCLFHLVHHLYMLSYSLFVRYMQRYKYTALEQQHICLQRGSSTFLCCTQGSTHTIRR